MNQFIQRCISRISYLYIIVVLSQVPTAQAKAETTWASVDRQIGEQKNQAALDSTVEILQAARKSKNNTLVTEALIRQAQLQLSLHGYETAVRSFKAEQWPDDPLSRVLLNLFYAQNLMIYHSNYSWEIHQREKTVESKDLDLKAWTSEQISSEISRSFDAIMSNESVLNQAMPDFFRAYITSGNYPKEVRPLLRDFIVYMLADHLSDTSYWSAKDSNEIYLLEIGKLASSPPIHRIPASDEKSHPLLKLASWIGEHKNFHKQAGRREAALEAQYQLILHLHGSATDAPDKAAVLAALVSTQKSDRELNWWSRGQALMADLIRANAEAGNLIKAERAAKEGAEAHPSSVGAQMCSAIVADIHHPSYEIQGMRVDALGKRSIEINYKNFTKIFFRAYPIELNNIFQRPHGYGNFFLAQNYRNDLLKNLGSPIAEWEETLTPTTDFAKHSAFVIPKIKSSGAYILLASMRQDFSVNDNEVKSIAFLASDLVLTSEAGEGRLEVRLLSGATGQAVANADIELYRFQWEHIPEKVTTAKTNDQGYVMIEEPKSLVDSVQSAIAGKLRFPIPNSWNYFLVAKHQGQFALDYDSVHFSTFAQAVPVHSALIFTDRSIYRPQQSIQWKVIAYSGDSSTAQFKTGIPGEHMTMHLHDLNGQIVATKEVVLNNFGTASGEFTIPPGRPLGQWRLSVTENYGGDAYVRIEEYKRPTFETTIQDATQALRLNRPAVLKGEARYYFGMPVAAGSVRWRVTRTEVYPWFWDLWGYGFFRGHSENGQTVASGISSLKPDGSFKVSFTPKVDERLAEKNKDLTYNFELTADVTDEGGETRSASKTFSLGFIAVKALITSEQSYFSVGQGSTIDIDRQSLDGKGKAGDASYRLVQLEQPVNTHLPADLPSQRATGSGDPYADFTLVASPGDSQRARWETNFHWEQITHHWFEGETLASGKLRHDATGRAQVTIKTITRSGVYRLIYETKDEFGSPLKTSRDFLVADQKTKISLPFLLQVEKDSYKVNDRARILVHSGFDRQPISLEIFRSGKLVSRQQLSTGRDKEIIELPITEADRGGFTIAAYTLRDHQLLREEQTVHVPWSDRELKVEFASFRDKLKPSTKEIFKVTVQRHDGKAVEENDAEILAYMYDRSLDAFAQNAAPNPLAIYPSRIGAPAFYQNLTVETAAYAFGNIARPPAPPYLFPESLKQLARYGIGGPGMRGGRFGARLQESYEDAATDRFASANAVLAAAPAAKPALRMAMQKKDSDGQEALKSIEPEAQTPPQLRSNFSETAFFLPHLISDKSGSASFEFTVPDSVTSWNVYAHAITRDLRAGNAKRETKSVKELMVRPYVPRFLREGDTAELKVEINNSSEKDLSGNFELDIEDADSNTSQLALFGLDTNTAKKPFHVDKGGSTTLTFHVSAPNKVGAYAIKAIAKSDGFSDGERRPIPVLPSRMHLAQSRFVTLHNQETKTMEFKDLASGNDPTLINEQMVVSVDGQLFYGVLQALPYLIKYPYECTEQTLNRFLSTGIVSSIFAKYPAVAKMAKDFSQRKTQLEKFDEPDANRRMALEETPWLVEAKGGAAEEKDLVNILDERVAQAERDRAISKIKKLQLPSGAFPWFDGGPADDYMTVYLLMGFARALEFHIEVPKEVAVRGWEYAKTIVDRDMQYAIHHDCCWEMITIANYAAGRYPDPSWTANLFTPAYRQQLADFSFKHWKEHSPMMKGYLALTLKEMNRPADAKLIWDSVMDSSKFDAELGTYWAPEDRSWLWYNDTTETQAFALRTLMELDPKDKRNDGLVQWLFLNKKLNHWKSTRATAEAIYSLAHYLDSQALLSSRESISVDVNHQKTQFTFEPDQYTGKKNQIVILGEKVDPKSGSKIIVEKSTPGFAFASATWHFSTEQLPKEEKSDFFAVSRKYFVRAQESGQWTLKPLSEATQVRVGDEIEVQLSLRTKHEAEYVHLRDPRAAGLEPETQVSGYHWDLGIYWYEETRDSGTNFFFSHLPVGEYTFKYRLRANMAGSFKIGPATVQSIYAPEFNAYSAGDSMPILSAKALSE